MSKGRIILVTGLVLVVVVVAGVLVLRDRLDGIVARAIAEHGSRSTGTEVTVGGVHLELREGRATIDDLVVANPDGFSDRPALVLGTLVLDLDPGSLTAEPYVIEDLSISDVSVLYEVGSDGRRNLEVIKANMQSADPAGAEADGEAPAPLLIVQRLHQTGGGAEVDASALGFETRSAELGDFTLTDLGAPDGAPADVIGRRALKTLIEDAARTAVNDELRSRLQEFLDDEGGDVADQVKDRIGDLIGN